MKIEGPTLFRRQRVQECSRVISSAVADIEKAALDAGWTPSELAEAFSRYAEGAKLRALPKTQYAYAAQLVVNDILKSS